LAGAAITIPLMVFSQLSIDWSTMDGGGGTSAGGAYSISDTVGQPDANALSLTGGSYQLSGGFWSIIAVQVPEAPWLSIVPSGPDQVTISWSPDPSGWVLQEATALTTNWNYSASGPTNPIAVTVTNEMLFYRLHKP
jgi:hypothetical protein